MNPAVLESCVDSLSDRCIPRDNDERQTLMVLVREVLSGLRGGLQIHTKFANRRLTMFVEDDYLNVTACAYSIPYHERMKGLRAISSLSPAKREKIEQAIEAFTDRNFRALSPFAETDVAHSVVSIYIPAYSTPFGPDVIALMSRLDAIETLLDAQVEIRAGLLVEEASRQSIPQPPLAAFCARTASSTRRYSAYS